MMASAKPAKRLTLIASGCLILALHALSGCSGLGGLSEEPPPGYSLVGTWRLNPSLSTDNRKAQQELQRARMRAGRAAERVEAAGPPGARGPRSGAAGDAESGMGPVLDRPLLPDVAFQSALLRSTSWLRIQQRGNELVLENGDTTRSFVPGQRSVVSVPSGVADQSAGWKGREFRIEIHPQLGPHLSQSYRLSPDGKQLVETLHVAADGRLPQFTVTHVYDAAQEVPQALPGED